ncbi:MAG: DUF4276 family protein [Treponema sp.]|nr:DUF4276 family protein [Treponema sp.]
MHFEILVEDISGEKMLEILVPKILNTGNNTFKIHHYNGIGSIPKGMKTVQDSSKRALLNQLPKLLAGYGRTFQENRNFYTVIVICDLDNRDKDKFLEELNKILENTNPAPQASFCLAVEEGEAWLLGDWSAIKKAYPKAKENIFSSYKNDSICGTWEKLADIVYPGGHELLLKKGAQSPGYEKTQWAQNITPYMDVNKNKSPSFNNFKKTLEEYCS